MFGCPAPNWNELLFAIKWLFWSHAPMKSVIVQFTNTIFFKICTFQKNRASICNSNLEASIAVDVHVYCVLASASFRNPVVILQNPSSLYIPESTTIPIRRVHMDVFTHITFQSWNPCCLLTTLRRPLLQFSMTFHAIVLQTNALLQSPNQCSRRAPLTFLH